MKRVIFQSCESHSYLHAVAKELERKSNERGEDFEFVDLVGILSKEDREWAFSTEMGDYVGVEKLGSPCPYAVIWAPTPIDENWFAKLASEGYQGKKILIYSWTVRSEEFSRQADCSFKIPTTNLADRIYEALRE